MLIAPARHIQGLDDASDEELLELTRLVRETQKVLSLAITPHGYNVGMNFGRCGGAGLPHHLHIHVVPRWDGDTNFMSVCGDTDVISQSLTELLEQLRQISKEHNLPNL
ncbi:MAG: HIT domain-containing protein [Planctomycetota bacterium]